MGKKSALVDKLVSKNKKKRELCLDLNSGSGMFVNKNSQQTDNIINTVLKTGTPKKLKPITSEKTHTLFNIDELNTNNPNTKNNIQPDIIKLDINPQSIPKTINTENNLNLETLSFSNNKPLTNLKSINPFLQTVNKEEKSKDKAETKIDLSTNLEQISNNPLISNSNNKTINNIITSKSDNIIKKEKKKEYSRFSTSNIINLSKARYNKLLDKESELQRKIDFENKKIEQMKQQSSQLDYIKKSAIEQQKLYELEKKLKKIAIIKFLHQKKLSIEKYKQNIEQYQKMMEQQKKQSLNQYNIRTLYNTNNDLNNSNNLLNKSTEIKYKYKRLITPDYNIDVINKILSTRNILYNQIIDKHKNNLLCIKNIESNKYNLINNYYINNINKLINLLNIDDKIWNTLYNTSKFNFTIIIK
jgi:hypothetical protein